MWVRLKSHSDSDTSLLAPCDVTKYPCREGSVPSASPCKYAATANMPNQLAKKMNSVMLKSVDEVVAEVFGWVLSLFKSPEFYDNNSKKSAIPDLYNAEPSKFTSPTPS